MKALLVRAATGALPALVAQVALVALLALLPATAAAGRLEREEISGLEYLEVLTAGASDAAGLPIVVAIHGLGDRPESFRLLLDDLPAPARVLVPRAPMPYGDDGFSWFQFHADDDESGAELGRDVAQAAGRVAQLVEGIANEHGQPARAVVCGFSQGGMLSFALAAGHPGLVAAAIPVSGYLPRALWPTTRPTVRPLPHVLALHGERDHLVSIRSARWSVEALRGNGYDAGLRSWPEVGHALVPDIRARLLAEVVRAVNELASSAEGAVGPPEPTSPPAAASGD